MLTELTDDAEATLSGSVFQILAAATGKSRLPIADSLKIEQKHGLVTVDRSVNLPDKCSQKQLALCIVVPFSNCQLSVAEPFRLPPANISNALPYNVVSASSVNSVNTFRH